MFVDNAGKSTTCPQDAWPRIARSLWAYCATFMTDILQCLVHPPAHGVSCGQARSLCKLFNLPGSRHGRHKTICRPQPMQDGGLSSDCRGTSQQGLARHALCHDRTERAAQARMWCWG